MNVLWVRYVERGAGERDRVEFHRSDTPSRGGVYELACGGVLRPRPPKSVDIRIDPRPPFPTCFDCAASVAEEGTTTMKTHKVLDPRVEQAEAELDELAGEIAKSDMSDAERERLAGVLDDLRTRLATAKASRLKPTRKVAPGTVELLAE